VEESEEEEEEESEEESAEKSEAEGAGVAEEEADALESKDESIGVPPLGQVDIQISPEDDADAVVDEFSDPPSLPSRQISRSPPQSRSPSPASLEKMMASLSLSAERSGIKSIVSSDLKKQRARQDKKHHSKRGARRAGRPQGSKAKQDTRLKLDKSGVWE
jgi:RIO kinase 2